VGHPVITSTRPRQSGKTTLARAVFPDLPYPSCEHLRCARVRNRRPSRLGHSVPTVSRSLAGRPAVVHLLPFALAGRSPSHRYSPRRGTLERCRPREHRFATIGGDGLAFARETLRVPDPGSGHQGQMSRRTDWRAGTSPPARRKPWHPTEPPHSFNAKTLPYRVTSPARSLGTRWACVPH
jgi:hypothetical protein